MPSPFPGVDPFIQSQMWSDFHSGFMNCFREFLVPSVRPQYVVNIERYVYVSRHAEEDEEEIVQIIAPDAHIADTGFGWREGAAGAAVTLIPVKHRVPMPKRRQSFLTIRTREARQIVTVVELLSPWNKRPGDGQAEYLSKRANVLYSTANLVELDLLRGGSRLPTVEPLQPGDYFAFVSRPNLRPGVDVYGWTMRDPLPTIPIPLAEGDAEVALDLQAVFNLSYDRAGYDYSLNYRAEVQPPLTADEAAWVAERLQALPANPR